MFHYNTFQANTKKIRKFEKKSTTTNASQPILVYIHVRRLKIYSTIIYLNRIKFDIYFVERNTLILVSLF